MAPYRAPGPSLAMGMARLGQHMKGDVLHRAVERLSINPTRGLVWAALSFAMFVAALFATLPILAIFNWFSDLPHLAEMATWSVVWGGLSLIGVLVAARLAFGAWLSVHPPGVMIAVVGVALSAVVHVVLQQWEIAQFGVPEAEYVGWTAGLFAVLIGLAVAVFGAFLAPKPVIGWPVSAVLLCAAGVAFILFANIPGLGDGVANDSWPLAIWVALSGLYALVAAGASVRRAIG